MKSTGNRILYIDNIRTLLVILVILLHVSIIYGPIEFWYYYEGTVQTSTYILGFFISITQAFFMGLFFMISAYFIVPSYSRIKTGIYIKKRLKRLGIPLLFYTITIGPFLLYIKAFFVSGYKVNFFSFYYNYIIKNIIIETGPLWFIEVLLIFTLIFIAIIVTIKKIKNKKIIIKKESQNFPENYRLYVFILILTVVTFISRLWFPIGGTAIGQLSFFPQYILLFVFGIFAYINNWFEKITYRKAIFWFKTLTITAPLWLLILYLSGTFEEGTITKFVGGFHWQAFLYSLWESILCVSISICIIYFFREKLNFQNKFLKILSVSAYTVFIIHPLIIYPLAFLIRAYDLHPLIKFLTVSVIGLTLSFLIGILVRKIPSFKKIL